LKHDVDAGVMRGAGDATWRVCAAIAAITFLTPLLSLPTLEPHPPAITVALIALAIVAAWRPSSALLVVTTLIPVVAWLGRSWNPSMAWAEALVVAYCAGYCARQVTSARDDRTDLDVPVILTAIVVIVSLAVQLLVDAWRFGDESVRAYLWTILTQTSLRVAANGDIIDPAMRLLESLVLLRAAAAAARESAFALALVRAVVFGAAAAGAVNVLRLWQGAIRLDSPLAAFGRYLLFQRFNAHYGDLNAAGSYFVMAMFPALGLAAARRAWGWKLAVVVIAFAAWIAGSRAAFVAALLVLVVPAAAALRKIASAPVRRVALPVAAIALVLVAVAAARSMPMRGTQQESGTALRVRLELARTSLRMIAAEPVFGVGIGRYYARSGEFSSPELLAMFPVATHENAHNNFFQITAELGLVGFGLFVVLLLVAARACVRLLEANPSDRLRWGVVLGLLAFVLSWLGGHPLLIDEPAFTFWILLGTACGWAGTRVSATTPRSTVWFVAVFAVVMLAAVPIRVTHERADFDLTHRGIGLSTWNPELDGVRYRRARSISTVFVPSDTTSVLIPLRAINPYDNVRVELWLDGRAADVVRARTDQWLQLRVLVPQGGKAPRFRRLELRVPDAAETDDVLMIGKVQPVGP
jgi:O-antigen ligase